LKQYCWRLGRSFSWGMAGTTRVDGSIWPCWILSASPWTKRTALSCDQVLSLDDLNRIRFAHSDTGKHLPISLSRARS
jgi:hypothetical protein